MNFHTRTPEQTISDPGVYYLPGSSRQYRDWKAGGHGSVNMFKAIQMSCDTYFYGLATELGIDNMFNYLSRFGFGKKTGIDLEGETSGLLPSQDWKMKRYQQIWYPGDTVSVGIGQGYSLVTPTATGFCHGHAGQRRRGIQTASGKRSAQLARRSKAADRQRTAI